MGLTLGRYFPTSAQDYLYGGALSDSHAEYSTEASVADSMRRCKEYTPPASAAWREEDQAAISVASFNLLAPCYKRLQGQRNYMGRTLRESHAEEAWRGRADDTLQFLKTHVLGAETGQQEGHSIIALQEFWLEPAYRQLFQAAFAEAGYATHALRRGEKKRDSVAVLYRSDQFDLQASREVHLVADDRVALLLHLHHKPSGRAVVVVSTHLTFPHSLFDRQLQLKQVTALAAALGSFSEQQRLGDDVVSIVAGDFNVEGKSPVCQFLRSRGFVASFDVGGPANNSAAAAADGGPDWVSHRSHLDEELGCDHIFVRRPRTQGAAQGAEEKQQQLEQQRLRQATGPDHIYIGNNAVVPASQACGKWDPTFTISDHRPVSTRLYFSRKQP